MTNKNIKFSLFTGDLGIFNTVPTKEINFTDLLRIYRSDKLAALTATLQNAAPEDRQQAKMKLPFVTPYGTFTTRKNENIQHHNSNLVALDIDGLTEHTAMQVKSILSKQPCTILAAISPRKQGVKALILISQDLSPEGQYQSLKHNVQLIANKLLIWEHGANIDKAQFVLSQPLFLAFDADLYINEDATPLQIKLEAPEPVEQKALNLTPVTVPIKALNRVESYILNANKILAEYLQTRSEGDRHQNIAKVAGIKSIIHYAPHLEPGIKQILWDAIWQSYGTETNAKKQGALRAIKTAWDKAPDLQNKTIETIIIEEKAKEKSINSLKSLAI